VLNAIEENGSLQCNKSRQGFKAASILRGLFDSSTVALDIFDKQGPGIGKELYDLIAAGNLDDALKKLTENGDNEWTVDLKRRYAQLKDAKIKNLMSFDEQSREHSKIVNDLLAYLSRRRMPDEVMGGKGGFGKFGRMDWLEAMGKQGFEFNPTITIHVENHNKNVNVQKTDPSVSAEINALKKQVEALPEDVFNKLKDFVETLPEPETPEEKESTGKQIGKWLNKNAEGIVGNVAASVYYDALKALFGIG
jgi:hypothetical protein